MKTIAFFTVVLLTLPLHAAVVSVLPLGDSITAGYDGSYNYPGYREDLYNNLASNDISIQYQGVTNPSTSGQVGYNAALVAWNQNYNDGFSGYTTSDILNNLATVTTPQFSGTGNVGGYWITGGGGTGRLAVYPNIVLFLAGRNDLYYGVPLATIEANYLGVLNWFSTNRPDSEVIASVCPPSADGSDLPEIEQFNSWLGSVMPSFPEDRMISPLPDFLNSDGTVNSSDLDSVTGYHPSDAGYTLIANEFNAAIVASVPEPTTLAILGLCGVSKLRRRSR